jgi:MFS family permease
LVVFLFQDPRERARAVGIYGLVCAAGGSLGEVLGGLLTQTLGWHWIFLVNLPIGIVVGALCWSILPLDEPQRRERRVDYPGACCITAALTLFVYAFINAGSGGWIPTQLVWLAAASVVLYLFITVEKRARDPLVPLHLFRHNFAVVSLLSALSTAVSYAWFAIAALYFQRILGYDPLHVGLAFIPSTAVIAILSAGFSEPIVARFGIRRPICAGLLLTAVGLALLSRAPLTGRFLTDILPGMLLVGLGGGISATPMILAATQDLPPTDSGLASGVLNTAFVIGGTLGIAAILTLADLRTVALRQVGLSGLPALDAGYRLAFVTLSFLASSASVLAAVLLKVRQSPS